MKTSLALIAALGLALPAAPALAQSQSLDIEYKDLNLATPEGQDQLDRRIDRAARAFCGADQPLIGTRVIPREVRKCVASVKKQANSQMATLVEQEQLGG